MISMPASLAPSREVRAMILALALGLLVSRMLGCDDEDGGAEGACTDYCEWQIGCGDDTALEECRTDCLAELAESTPACSDALVALFECYGRSECISMDNPDPCEAEDIAQGEACRACTQVLDACTSTWSCTDERPTRELACDDTTCRCIEEGTEISTCASEGVCAPGLDEDTAYTKAFQCCGWDDFEG